MREIRTKVPTRYIQIGSTFARFRLNIHTSLVNSRDLTSDFGQLEKLISKAEIFGDQSLIRIVNSTRVRKFDLQRNDTQSTVKMSP